MITNGSSPPASPTSPTAASSSSSLDHPGGVRVGSITPAVGTVTPGMLFLLADTLEREKHLLRAKFGQPVSSLVEQLQRWVQAYGAVKFDGDNLNQLMEDLRRKEAELADLNIEDERIIQREVGIF